jgi:hypothetical protein
VNVWIADLVAFIVPSPMHPLWGRLVEPVYRRFTGVCSSRRSTSASRPWSGRSGRRQGSAEDRGVGSLGARVLRSLGYVSTFWGPTPSSWGYAVSVRCLGCSCTTSRPEQHPGRQPLRLPADAPVSPCSSPRTGWLATRLAARARGQALVVLATVNPRGFRQRSVAGARRADHQRRTQRSPARPARRLLVDIPLDWTIARYHCLQTAHHQRLIMRFLPRPTYALVHQADLVPSSRSSAIGRIAGAQVTARTRFGSWSARSQRAGHSPALWRSTSPTGSRRSWPRRFPWAHRRGPGLVVFLLRRTHARVLWRRPDTYRLDFGPGGEGSSSPRAEWPPRCR